jgi:hypothetical protein
MEANFVGLANLWLRRVFRRSYSPEAIQRRDEKVDRTIQASSVALPDEFSLFRALRGAPEEHLQKVLRDYGVVPQGGGDACAGWQVCCLFNAAKELQTQQAIAAPSQATAGPSPSKKAKGAQQPSDAQSVCTFFDGFRFADTSEYTNLDTKLSKDCLLVYERMTAVDCAKLLLGDWSRLGPKNALDRLHMLIQISQRVASSCGSQPDSLRLTLQFVMKYLFVRMVVGTLDSHVGVRALRLFLSVPLMILKILQYEKTEFVYKKAIEIAFLSKFEDPEIWYAQLGAGDRHQRNPPP